MPIKIGRFIIPIDGKWNISDLNTFSSSMSESYGLFFAIFGSDYLSKDKYKSILIRHFWRNEYFEVRIGEYLYRTINEEGQLNVNRIQYASPGFVELAGSFAVLTAMGLAVKTWINTASDGLDLIDKAEIFFKKHKIWNRPTPRRIDLSSIPESSIDDASDLTFEFGKAMGFSKKKIESIIELTSSPIAALRLMRELARESNDMMLLQNRNLLVFPDLPELVDDD